MINETGVRGTTFHRRRSSLSRAKVFIAALVFSPGFAQNSSTAPLGGDIQQTYAKLCGGCHGLDARGTQQGPGLIGNASARKRSVQTLRDVIRNGIPSAGMPAFNLQ